MSDLHTLADRIAIEDQFSRYAVALDLPDWDLLASLFAEDAVFKTWRDGTCIKSWTGVDEIVAGTKVGIARHIVVQHVVANHLITVDGDRARALAYMSTVHLDGTDRPDAHGDRFLADLVRRTDGWKIAYLKQTSLWREGQAAKGPLPEDDVAEARRHL